MKKILPILLLCFCFSSTAQTIEDFSTEIPVTDNTMSVVFSTGTLSDYVGGAVQAYVGGAPVSTSWLIYEEGTGIPVIGTMAEDGLFYASPGDQLTFAILMNGETIVMVDVDPPVTYAANSFQMLDNETLTFTLLDGAAVVFGCTDASYLEFDASANLDNDSCAVLVAEGCTDANAFNYNDDANTENGTCLFTGCMDTSADNYDSNANVDGYCQYLGCMDATACNYDANANEDDTSCEGLVGCMDPAYYEFSASATCGDGSCSSLFLPGCTDPSSYNYSASATEDDGSCVLCNPEIYYGCSCCVNANGSLPLAAICGDQSTCYCNETYVCETGALAIYGCTEPSAFNYNDDANTDDGSCVAIDCEYYNCCGVYNYFLEAFCPSDQAVACSYNCAEVVIGGCMNPTACNYSEEPIVDDGSCTYPSANNLDCNGVCLQDIDEDGVCDEDEVSGCNNADACNYYDLATENDLSCEYAAGYYNCDGSCLSDYDGDGVCDEFEVSGCDDSEADNYNEEATDAGFCEYFGCIDSNALNYDPTATSDDGSCLSVEEYTIDSLEIAIQVLLEESTLALSSMQHALGTWNTTIDLTAGWNMFGYGCPSPIDLVEGLSNHTESIILVKDFNGDAYLPEWNFNGIGALIPGFGYQIKVTEVIEGFSLCDWYVNDIPEDNIVSLQDSLELIISQIGCIDSLACNYDITHIYYDGSCEYISCVNCMDESACNYNSEAIIDYGLCEYPQYGFDCNEFVIAEIGDEFQGGILFYINETGQHGIVAAPEDIGSYAWGCPETPISGADGQAVGAGYLNTLEIVSGCSQTPIAASRSLAYVNEGYLDWYLPSFDELTLMYSNISQGSPNGNSGGFINDYYWSSSESVDNIRAWLVYFGSGNSFDYLKQNEISVRPIRSF